MSSRRGGAGGRKGKTSKSNKQGKALSNTSECVTDHHHNQGLPCSQFLQDTCKEVWTIDEEESSLLSLPPSSSAQERSDKRFGRMLRHHLLEKRRQEVVASANRAVAAPGDSSNNPSGDASATTPPKKKKKKKKKKANKQQCGDLSTDGATTNGTTNGAADEQTGTGNEADATVAITCSVSQEDSLSSDMILTASAKEEMRISASSAATSATMATSTTSSITNDTAPATSTSSTDNQNNNATTNATATSATAWTTPVDAYLDRLQVQQDQVQKRLETEQSIMDANNTQNNHNSHTKLSTPRDLESFVQFLNKRHGPSATASTSTTSNHSKGLVITQQEVEAACQSIDCDPCRRAMLHLLSQGNIQRQPVVLGGISFGDNKNNNKARSFPRNHHNGLALPVDHPALGIRQDPTSSVDFDYVALEEGSNPVGAWMEAKADLQGVPYFHPEVSRASDVTSTAPSSLVDPLSSNNNNNHHQKHSSNSRGESSKSKQQQQQHAAQLEWRFVSSSATRNQTMKDCSLNATQTPKSDTTASNKPKMNASSTSSSPSSEVDQKNTNTDTADGSIVTVQDVEHILKNVMLPLSMSVDELFGVDIELSQEEVGILFESIKRLDFHINNECRRVQANIKSGFAELKKIGPGDENLELKAAPTYLQYNEDFHNLLVDIVMEITWHGTLWLEPEGETRRVIRTTEAWWNMVEHLTDAISGAIFQIMRVVEQYETALQEEIAENSGKIPEMYLSKPHRAVFLTMLAGRVEVTDRLFRTVSNLSTTQEEIWPISPSAFRNNGDGLRVPFRRKFFAQQEFCRVIRNREEGTKKGSTTGSKAKRDALQRHKVASSTTASSSSVAAAIGTEKWIQTLDMKTNDLLRALVDLTRYNYLPRLAELKEEQMVRCQKGLGMLASVARDIFVPLGDTDRAKDNPTSFVLQNDNLKSRCQSLSEQIKQEEELQQQQQLLAAPGEEEPSVMEQKRTVARLTTESIKLLLHLRRCVTDAHERKSPPPSLPMQVISWLGVDVRFQHVDMRDCSYSALVNARMSLQNRFNRDDLCIGEGSGMPRLTSILLALFYRKLKEQCSEWHAELAGQELLTNMTENDSGLQTGSISGDPSSTNKKDAAPGRNGTTVNSSNQGKANKKTKKKQKKSASATQSSTSDGMPGSGQEAASEPQKTPDLNSSSSSDEKPGVTSDGTTTATATATSMNGHQQANAAVPVKECLVAEETAGKKTKTKGNTMKENKINSKEVLEDTNKVEAQSPEKSSPEEISTAVVDKDMGVKDHLGAFDSAESFLVKRLTTLFKEAAQDSSSVVII